MRKIIPIIYLVLLYMMVLPFVMYIDLYEKTKRNFPEAREVSKEDQIDLTGSQDMNDSDELNDIINEYLSSIYMTDIFIKELTEYFDQVYKTEHRKVIVCMVGDHAPEFVRYIRNPSISAWEAELR